LSENRAANISDGVNILSTVMPGWNARFQFKIKAPSTPGTYKAYFTPVVDGTQWMSDIGLYWEIKVKQSSVQQGPSQGLLEKIIGIF